MLPRLYQHIVIPTAMCGELKSPRAPQAVRDWTAAIPPGWKLAYPSASRMPS